MTKESKLTLFHSPNTRSTGALMLLEEIGAPYHLHVIDMKAGEQRQPAYLAINPMGKVPAVRRGDAVITEQVAVYIYLADLFPEAGLAPALADPLRGPYLRWLAFYGSSFEPAVVDRHMERDQAPLAMSPYGDFETMFRTLCDKLGREPYLLGERFSAADVLWGTALGWTTRFGIVPKPPEVAAYIDRVASRPAAARVRTKDAELVAAQTGGQSSPA